MPRYTFTCDSCGAKEEVVRSMSEAPNPRLCKCLHVMRRDFQADRINAGNRDYSRPIVSESLAMGQDQIVEHRKMFPDIEVTPDGCPVFDNYAKHEKYLNDTGFKKAPQKIRRRSATSLTTTYKRTHRRGAYKPPK